MVNAHLHDVSFRPCDQHMMHLSPNLNWKNVRVASFALRSNMKVQNIFFNDSCLILFLCSVTWRKVEPMNDISAYNLTGSSSTKALSVDMGYSVV